MDFPRVGYHDAAVDQLGKHELMDSSSRRMDPFKPLRLPKLLRLDRPADHDIGVGDFLAHSIIVGKVDPIDLRKCLAQTPQQPRRSLPKFKGMVVDDEDFHDE